MRVTSLLSLALLPVALGTNGRRAFRRDDSSVEVVTTTTVAKFGACPTGVRGEFCTRVPAEATLTMTFTTTHSAEPFFPIPNSTVSACQGSTCVTGSGTIGTIGTTSSTTSAETTTASSEESEPTQTSGSDALNSDEEGDPDNAAVSHKGGVLGLAVAAAMFAAFV